jgi:2-succinyl-6-hydroxy-2,4-cyclohexadiene-1-carboxylate synthase
VSRKATEPRYPVLLHGFTGSSAMWGDTVLDGLSGAGLPPLLVDLPGHGRNAGETDASRFSLDATLARIGEAGRWPADLVGYSMGGRIALHFAATFPGRVERLVLESASPGLSTEAERRTRRSADEALAARIEAQGIEAFVDAWEAQPLFESRRLASPDVRARQHELRLKNDARSLATALVALGTGALPSLWERLPSISVPTLLVVGSLDLKFVDIAERMAAAMPDARVAMVEGAGHTVHLERPDAWVAAVSAFLLADSPG